MPLYALKIVDEETYRRYVAVANVMKKDVLEYEDVKSNYIITDFDNDGTWLWLTEGPFKAKYCMTPDRHNPQFALVSTI